MEAPNGVRMREAASKANEMKSAAVKHDIGSYYGGKNSNENMRWN